MNKFAVAFVVFLFGLLGLYLFVQSGVSLSAGQQVAWYEQVSPATTSAVIEQVPPADGCPSRCQEYGTRYKYCQVKCWGVKVGC